MAGAGLIWDLLAKDHASPAFLRVAGAADKAAASTERATKGMAASVARMGAVGSKLTKSVTLPIVALGAVSVAQASKYQKSLNTIAVATDQTSAQLASSSKGLMSIAKSTGTSLSQLTDGLYTIEKGGLRGNKALAALKAAAQGAKAESVDLATATQALSSVMASYGSTLADPVKAENEIIRGAGLAKTTMQDFANSLSNVVPIASSLGIGFDQVAGAIATMTQHGETAQRATENLGNLITNLAGQNNVASQALQQLGVNTIDLSKNLGKRGLVGSLNVVLDHIAKYRKGGVIVTSAFKQAATATASLRTELAAMPPALKKASEQFDAGTMSYKDYYSFVKSLGGQQFVLGKNFLATEQTAKGFNNQLKNGNSTTRTLAATLQKALGGVTGMRVALMLSGQSADSFAKSTKSVKKAAGETKGDVLGWAKTQETLAVKMDKAKASLQVMAVEIGSKLIPVVGKLADAGSKLIHWFDGLSGTQKKVLGWSLGVIAALGPLLSIGARLAVVSRGVGRFVGGVGTSLARLAGTSEAQATRIGLAARGIGAALSGVGIGLAVGTMTRDASTTKKLLASLGAAGAGAAVGWSMGGPWGAALGGLAGGLTSLASQFLGTGDSADKASVRAQIAMAAEKRSVDALLDSLKAVGGQYGEMERNSLADQLLNGRKGNLIGDASSFGIDPRTLADYVQGVSGSFDKLYAEWDKFNATHGGKKGGIGPTPADFQRFMESVQAMSGDLGAAESKWELYLAVLGKTVVPTRQLAGGMKNLAAELAATGTALDVTGAEYEDSSAFARRNTEILKENVEFVTKKAAKELIAGKSLDSVKKKYAENIAALRGQMVVLGFNSDQVDTLIGRFAHLPKKVITDIIQKGLVPADIQAIIDALNAIPTSKTITIYQDTILRSNGTTVNPDKGPVNVGVVPVGSKQTGGHSSTLTGGGPPTTGGRAAAKDKIANPSTPPVDNSGLIEAIRSAMQSLRSAANSGASTAGELREAAKSLYGAAKDGHASAKTLAKLAADSKALTRLGRQRDRVRDRLGTAPAAPTAYDRLSAAKQRYSDERSSVKSAITGTFDVGNITASGAQYGEPITLRDIRGQLAKAVANARRFVHVLRKLSKEGLNRGLLAQLAQAGPAALPQALALASATPKQLASLNGQYKELNNYGSSAGKFMADQMYGAGVNSAQALVNGLKSKESALNKAIRNLATGMIAELRKSLDMHSPSRRLYREMRLAWRGAENATADAGTDISRAAGRILGNRPAPAGHMARGGHGGYVHIEKQELHVHYPEDGDLDGALKQLSRMTASQIRAASQKLGG